MSRVKQVVESSFWKRVSALSKLVEPQTAQKLAMEFGVDEAQIKTDIKMAEEFGLFMKFEEIGDDLWIIPSDQVEEVSLSLSTIEWGQLNNLFNSVLSENEYSDYHPLLNQIKNQSEVITEFDHLASMSSFPVDHIHSIKDYTLQRLEEAMMIKSLVHIDFIDGKKKLIYPIKVIHLEGELSLVGEDSHDHCLFVMNLTEMKKVKVMAQHHRPQVTPFELEEFISAIRNMNEKETRLILKIHDPESVNLFPNHHFLGKPCMITNPSGDLIWAAYVEPCAALFDWLMELGTKVEILDPVQFKSEYLGYCEEKLSKIA